MARRVAAKQCRVKWTLLLASVFLLNQCVEETVPPTAAPTATAPGFDPVTGWPQGDPYQLEVLISMPWGRAQDEIPSVICYTPYSEIIHQPSTQIIAFRPDQPIYVDRAMNVYVMAGDMACFDRGDTPEYTLLGFDTEGALMNRIEIVAAGYDEIPDGYYYQFGAFAVDGDRLYILDYFSADVSSSNYPNSVMRLCKLSLYQDNTSGDLQAIPEWAYTYSGSEIVVGDFDLLVGPSSEVYVIYQGEITEFDPATGQVERSMSFERSMVNPMLAGDGSLYAEEIRCDLTGETCTDFPSVVFAFFLGIDVDGNVYEWRGYDASIVRLLVDEGLAEYRLEGVVYHEGAGLYLSFWDEDHLTMEILHWDAAGQYMGSDALDIPDLERSYYDQRLVQLVQVDTDGGYFVSDSVRFSSTNRDQAIYYYVSNDQCELLQRFEDFYGDDDSYAAMMLFMLPIESRVEHFTYMHVDDLGRIYIPVIDPEGFRVVRLTPLPYQGEE